MEDPGGNTLYGHASFPKLPKGCTFDYTFQKPTEKPQPDTKPEPKPSPSASTGHSTPTAPKPQTAGQTSVVPKGGVAAGAEIPADTADRTAYAAGAGLVAALGALGAGLLLRRRSRTQG